MPQNHEALVQEINNTREKLAYVSPNAAGFVLAQLNELEKIAGLHPDEEHVVENSGCCPRWLQFLLR